MIPTDFIIQKKDQIVGRRIAGETILVPIRGNLADMERIFALNPVGEYIWERLDGIASMETISRDIVAEFDVDAETANRDMRRFIAELIDQDLVFKI